MTERHYWDGFRFRMADASAYLRQHSCPLHRAIGTRLGELLPAIELIEYAEDKYEDIREDEIQVLKTALGRNAESLILMEVIARGEKVLAEVQNAVKEAKQNVADRTVIT